MLIILNVDIYKDISYNYSNKSELKEMGDSDKRVEI